MEDEERPGQPKKFEDEELEALLDEDCCQTEEELAESLGDTQAAILKSLKPAGYIQKQGNWVSHELKPRDVERRFCLSEMLLERHKQKSFLHRIVNGDEKWIYYDNPKRRKSYVKPGQPAKSTEKLFRLRTIWFYIPITSKFLHCPCARATHHTPRRARKELFKYNSVAMVNYQEDRIAGRIR